MYDIVLFLIQNGIELEINEGKMTGKCYNTLKLNNTFINNI